LADQNKTRNRILNILKIVISVAGVLILVLTQDMEHVLYLLKNMHWWCFLGALFLFLSGSLVRAYRWGVLVWALGGHVSWWRLVGLYFVGAFFGLFLPTGVGGDAVKMYEDRFLGLFVLFALALLTLLIGYEMVIPQVRILIATVFVGALIIVALLIQRTWIEALGRWLGLDRLFGRFQILRDLYASIHIYGPQALFKGLVASLVWNLILILGYYLLGLAVGIDLSGWYYFLFVPLISAALMVPSVGGLGIREWATVLLFKQVGVPETQALALALAYDIVLLINGLLGATIYILQGMREARR